MALGIPSVWLEVGHEQDGMASQSLPWGREASREGSRGPGRLELGKVLARVHFCHYGRNSTGIS